MAAKSKPAFHWLIPAIVAVFLFLTAVYSKPFRYSAVDLGLLALLYGLLALVIYLPALIAVPWGRLPAFVGALTTAFILALHYREQTRPSGTAESLDKPEVLAAFALGWVAVAVLYYFATRVLCPPDIGRRSGIMLIGVMPLLFGVLTVSYYASNTFRWHLLRHNTLLGAASYHLFADDTASVRDAMWEENEAMSPVPTSDAGGAPARSGESLDSEVPAVDESAAAQASNSAANIVFVLVDTLRTDALAAYGGNAELMPFLNSYAERSFVFTDVKANSSWTFPSMASFFTGLLPEEHGAVWGSSLGEDKWTLAEAMAARGYRTAAFVSNGVAVREDRGMSQGFEEFHQLGTRGAMYPRADEMNDAAFEWLQEHPTDDSARQPVFLYVHYLDPHTPYLAAGVVDPASHDEAMDAYDTELRYLDEQLRRLVEGLEAQLDGHTHLFLVSDHGEEFGEHGERGHGRATSTTSSREGTSSICSRCLQPPRMRTSRHGRVPTRGAKDTPRPTTPTGR